MLVKILGILDIFIAIVFWLFGILNLFPNKFILILGFILLIKGLVSIFGWSIASFFDVVCGVIIIIASSVAMPKVLVIILVLVLLEKGIISLL